MSVGAGEVFLHIDSPLELFVSRDRRGRLFGVPIQGSPSVKDVFESAGIPHPEVLALEVNGRPGDFRARIRHGDVVRLWHAPTHQVTLPLRPPIATPPRFILDEHLHRLASWLRIFGFDTLLDESWDDPDLAEVSALENRILLTRDVGLLKRARVIHGAFVREIHPENQVMEIMSRFRLTPWVRPFERCPVCNGLVTTVAKSAIEHRLQPATRENYDEFFRCEDCDRIYWRGSHYARMSERLARFTSPIDTRKSPRVVV